MVEDMNCLNELTVETLLWNLKIRYDKNQIYVWEYKYIFSIKNQI